MDKTKNSDDYLTPIKNLNISTLQKEQKIWANDAYINCKLLNLKRVMF